MAEVTKTVDKTLVNGSEIFIYTVNVSYSGLTQPSENGYLIDFFPSKIKYSLPQIGGQIKNITQLPATGGTNVKFDFGSVNAGTSLSFTIACSFGPGRVENDTFGNVADLYADTIKVATGNAPIVNLKLNTNFRLSKTADKVIVRPNQQVTFYVDLYNSEDVGGQINNINFTDTLPTGLTPDLSYTPVGNDLPSNGYSDPTYNGKTGTWTGDTLNFSLPSFKGAYYRIIFKAIVDGDVVPGQIIVNTAKWTQDGQSKPDGVCQLKVFSPTDAFTLAKYGCRTGIIGNPGSPVNFTISNSNADTINHNNYTLLDEIPPQLDITRLTFNMDKTGMPSYSIQISLRSNSANYLTVVDNADTSTTNLVLTPFIPSGDGVATIKVTAPILLAGKPNSHFLMLYGYVNNTGVQDQIVVNKATSNSDDITLTRSASVILNGASDLYVQKGFRPFQNAYYPLEEFETAITSKANTTIVDKPVLADLMPNELKYILDSEYFVYYNLFTGKVYDSRNSGFPIDLPTREIIDNYKGTGKTLLRWKFNFVMPQGDYISVVFKNFVVIGPPSNTFVNYAYAGNPGKNVLTVYSPVTDTNDYDGDGITDENISQKSLEGVILTTSEFSLKKLVKGKLDLDYSGAGKTTEGGEVDYQLMITNNQKMDLKNIEIVDILPFVGDKGVILTNQPRSSQFDVYATGAVEAKIINLLGNPVAPNPTIFIEYSTSQDPKRFDSLGNPIGIGEWSTTLPVDITTLRSVKVTTDGSVILKPYERLVVTIHTKAPVGATINSYAYNSFAVRANKIVGTATEPLLPTEPNKVGVQIQSEGLASIGQFVWEDYNKDGIWQSTEPGVNGIRVELYDSKMKLLSYTITSNNALGKPGYYMFSNLSAGSYFVKFIPYSPYTITVQNLTQPNGSRPSPTTGLTNQIDLVAGQKNVDINAGLIGLPCSYPKIYANDQCLYVGEKFDPLKGVTATDCRGKDITSSIKVIKNTVDMTQAGVYEVVYSVTDYRGQTTTLTISVIVCKKSARKQSITDLIESVALIEASISHIMNAEAEKISKAKEMNFDDAQLKAINESVKIMTISITKLSVSLKNKLKLFEDKICTGNCCENFEKGE